MLSRPRKKNKNRFAFDKKLIIMYIAVIACILMLIFIANYIYTNNKIKKSLETDVVSKTSEEYSDVFKIDKIYLYSSANAKNNETNRDLWNLNVFQYTDIAIYINSSNTEFTQKNTIKSLSIDNIEFTETQKGTPGLYYKDIQDFGKCDINEDAYIDNSLNFEIEDSTYTLDTNTAKIYNTLQNPITLEYINKDIKTNAIIPNTNEQLKYNGELLSKAKISLNSIECMLSFNINITNNLDEKYVNKVSIKIPLEDDNTNIYSGFIKKELTNIPNSNFIKNT